MARPLLLVVDDDPYTRSALKALFTNQGWQVMLASTVAQALTALEAAPLCVLLDLNLPDGAGESVLREVRSHLPRTRVAVCSGLTDARRLARVREMNPELMLWKPIEMAQVFQLCESARAASA